MTPNIPSSVFRLLIYTAFFASGASSLIAEVTWNRMLIVVVGNSLSAAALIIGIFMGGLGVGSYVGGRIFSRRRRSLLPYVALELAIGAYVLLSPFLFESLSGFFTSLAVGIENRSALTALRIVVSVAALFLPAALMGATFPAMISGAAPDSPDRRSARTGYLYSVNTLGAATGCFAAGYHLLFEFGVQTTLTVAFSLYVVAALSALLANTLVGRKPEKAQAAARVAAPAAGAAEGPAEAAVPGLARFLALATFAVGFVALAYEVLLTRLGILYLGNSVSVFPLVLTGFLIGTGVSAIAGTWLHGVLKRHTGASDRLFGFLALGAGVFVLVTPYLLLQDWMVGVDDFARHADAGARNPLPILAMIIAPTVLIGALLPVAIRMLQSRGRGEATREAATLYALNTSGGVVGAAVANHFLVPRIGVQSVLIVLAVICFALAAINLFSPAGSPRRRFAALGGVAVLAVVLVAGLPDMMQLYAGRLAASTRAESVEVRLVYEGRAATVTVLDQTDPRRGTYRDMYLNGVEEASTRYWHAQLFKLLGILPVLLHEPDRPKEALVIAFGAGITAGSVLASDRVASLDVVDLNPDVEGINDLFTEVNGDVFHKPRFHFHNDDGRNFLVTSGRQYDLIIGDSTHPRAYDSWILYTEEFYRAVRERLRPDGIFAQWVPVLGSMRGDLFRIHLNTFRSVFPTTTFWYVYGSDQAFLLATPRSFSLDVERLQGLLDELPAWFQADHYDIDTAVGVAGFFWLDEGAMERMIGVETRINTDDFHYFDKQSAVRASAPQWQLPPFQASLLPHATNAPSSFAGAVRAEQTVALHLANFGFYGSTPDLYRAYCRMPDNGNARYWMDREFAGQLPDHEVFCRDLAIQDYRAVVAQHPDNAGALNALADVLAEAGQLDEAMGLVERAVALEPQSGMILDTYGWILFKKGRYAEAIDTLERSASFLPDHPIVLYHIGAVHYAAGRTQRAKEHLERALRASSDFAGADSAREILVLIESPGSR